MDDKAGEAAVAYLKDPDRKKRPFALCVGFIAPHFPFVVPEPYFSRYYPERADLPDCPEEHLGNLPPAAQRLRTAFGFWGHTEEQTRRARAAYYGLASYLDDKISHLLDALDSSGLAENTVVIHTSDHGEMLGEHGLWRKMCFYEQAARIPMQIRWPGVLPSKVRITNCVSLIDTTATILDVAGVSMDEQKNRWQIDGDALLPLVRGETETWKDEAFAEHNAHGTDRPRAMLRQGQWKLCYSYSNPPELELYDLDSDPGEMRNLTDVAEHSDVQNRLLESIRGRWDGERNQHEVRASQEDRWLIRNTDPKAGLF